MHGGLGGLGHMGVKLAASMGAKVTVFSTTSAKEEDAKRLGATDFAVTKIRPYSSVSRGSSISCSTPSPRHTSTNAYLGLPKPRGAMCVVGAPPEPTPVTAFALMGGNKKLAGSSTSPACGSDQPRTASTRFHAVITPATAA